MGLDIELVNQLVEEFHNTQLEITERDLRNIPNPEDTLFALGLEDMIKQYQINYQEGVYEKEEIDLIVSKLPNKPLEEDLSEIGKILLESKINHLKAIYTNVNNGYYNKALKTIHKPQAKAIENKEKAISAGRVAFKAENAEYFSVPREVDRIYFFNPFSLEILQKVIHRILESYYEKPREIKLLFYYPSDEYISYLMTVDEFLFEDEIDCRDLFPGNDMRERIVIFGL